MLPCAHHNRDNFESKFETLTHVTEICFCSRARLGLIAEHGYWVKPAAAHRSHAWNDRGARDDTTNARTSDQCAHVGKWGTEGGNSEGRFTERRGNGVGTNAGRHTPGPHMREDPTRAKIIGAVPPSSPESFTSRQHPNQHQHQQRGDDARQEEGGSEWVLRSHNADLSWRDEVLAILENFTGRTPGSFLELKDRYTIVLLISCDIGVK